MEKHKEKKNVAENTVDQAEISARVRDVVDSLIESALSENAEIWGVPHPVAAADAILSY
jgi:hypothetical protein